MALGTGPMRQLTRCGVETRQVAVLLLQQSHEAGHAVVVGRSRREARVVEARGNPLLIEGPEARGILQRTDVGAQTVENLRLGGAHLLARLPRGVEAREACACRRQQTGKFRIEILLLSKGPHARGLPLVREPALEADILD